MLLNITTTIQFSDIVIFLFGLVFGFLGFWYNKRMKGKNIILKKSVRSQLLAFSINDARLGELKIIYDGYESNNIYFITVEIVNESGRNCDEFILEVAVPQNSVIYRHQADLLTQGVRIMQFVDEEFLKYFDDVRIRSEAALKPISEQLQNEITTVTTNRRYKIPVFNDNSTLIVEILAGSYSPIQNMEEEVKCIIIKNGIDLVVNTEEDARKKRFKKQNEILFSIVFLFSAIPIYYISSTKLSAIALMLVSVMLSSVVSYSLLTLIKYIKKEFFDRG